MLPASGVGSRAPASGLLAGETDGLGIDFTHPNRNRRMHVLDTGTPANTGLFDPYSKLTYTSPSLKLCRQSDGVWRYGNHNLFTFSQDFSNAAWTKTNASITADATTAPDGTSTADTLVENTSNAEHRISRGTPSNIPNFPAYFAIWAKAKERTWIRLATDGGDSYFDLGNGVMGATNQLSGTITSAGDGWYLCKIAPANLTNTIYVNLATGNGTVSYTGDGTSGAYFWGAQIKRTPVSESVALAGQLPAGYVLTTSAAAYDLPYEWDASNASLGILIEEQRTNLVLRSQEITSATYWTDNNVSSTADQAASPDGRTTGDLITASATNTVHNIFSSTVTLSASTVVTFSMFVKKNTHRYVYLNAVWGGSGTTWIDAVFDLDGGGSSATQTAAGSGSSAAITSTSQTDAGNGWYRLSMTGSSTATNPNIAIGLVGAASGHSPGSFGDITYNAAGTETIYVWGAQIEAGSFPTSPIHTIGATVTRAKDQLTLATSAFPAVNGPGTAVAWVTPRGLDGSKYPVPIAVHDGALSGGSADSVQFYIESGANYRFAVTNGGTTTADITSSTAAAVGTTAKLGAAWDTNDAALVYNAGSANTDATVTKPSGLTTVTFGGMDVGGGDNLWNGYLRQLTLLPRRATNGELQTRTS